MFLDGWTLSLSRISPSILSILLLLWSPCERIWAICPVLGLLIVKNSFLNASAKFGAPSVIIVFGLFPAIPFASLNNGSMLEVYLAGDLFGHPSVQQDILDFL